jgi:hypothetical protein
VREHPSRPLPGATAALRGAMIVTIPWSADPVANRKNIEAAMEARSDIQAEPSGWGYLRAYRVDRMPIGRPAPSSPVPTVLDDPGDPPPQLPHEPVIIIVD